MEQEKRGFCAVIGGANVDIGGQAFAPLVSGDSNPGRVSMSLGGVGRNIAHNLRLLEVPVELLTAYGDDFYGQLLQASCAQLGIGLGRGLCLPEEATSTYVYLAGPRGEMALAVSDMQVCRWITPDYLAGQLPLLKEAAVVAADANIPGAALAFLGEHCAGPLFVDPVSTAKAEKLLPILPKIHTLKPNRLEAELLSGVAIREKADVPRAARALLDRGVKRVFLSLGAGGVYAAQGDQGLFLPPFPGEMVNTTGCGDAFLAALIWAYREGLDLEGSARAGLAAAAIAMESPQTIHPGLGPEALSRRMAGLF